MTFTPEELKYLYHVLSVTSNYTRARAEQVDLLSVDHDKLQKKSKDQLLKVHWK